MTLYQRTQLRMAMRSLDAIREPVIAGSVALDAERRAQIEREWEEREYQAALHEAATSAARRSQ